MLNSDISVSGAMGIVIGSCVPEEEPDTNQRFHRVVYGILWGVDGVCVQWGVKLLIKYQ